MDGFGWIQLTPLIIALAGIFFETKYDRNTQEDARKQVFRSMSAIAIAAGIAGIIYGRFESHRERMRGETVLRQQLEAQRKQIELSEGIRASQQQTIAKADRLAEKQEEVIEGQQAQREISAQLRTQQGKSIRDITRLSLDRYLSGLEISYRPSSTQWNTIDRIYRGLKPNTGESSYYDAPIIAERTADGWSIIFGWANIIEDNKFRGMKMFLPVFASDKDDKGFASIVREACIPLLIRWSDGSETDIEPWTKRYPSIVSISRDRIAFILRPPLLNLYLGAFRDNPSLTLRTRMDYPRELKFRSLDGNVKFDEIVQLHWKRDDSTEPADRVKPFTDSVRLHPRFRTVSD